MFKSTSTSLLVLGALAIIAGIIALAWPGVTVLALVILFAVYAFTDAGVQAMRAFSSPGAGPVVGHLLLAVLDLAAGVTALVWPAPTALVLVIVVGLWAFVSGCTEFFAAFASGESCRHPRPVHRGRAGVRRLRCRAVRPARCWRGHPRPDVRPVRPDLRGFPDLHGCPAAAYRADPALSPRPHGLIQMMETSGYGPPLRRRGSGNVLTHLAMAVLGAALAAGLLLAFYTPAGSSAGSLPESARCLLRLLRLPRWPEARKPSSARSGRAS